MGWKRNIAIGTLAAAILGFGGYYSLQHRKAQISPAAENAPAAVEQTTGQDNAPHTPAQQKISDGFRAELDQITKDHTIKYTTDNDGHVSRVYVAVNPPASDKAPCERYDSLSAITERLYGKENLSDHKQHLRQLIEDNRQLVGNNPDLVLPGNLVDITTRLTQICSADELDAVPRYFNESTADTIIVPREVEQANHSRMKYNGTYHAKPCGISAPVVAKQPANPAQPKSVRSEKPATTVVQENQTNESSFSAAKPDECGYVRDINQDLDKGENSATRNRYDTILVDLRQQVSDVEQLTDKYKAEGFTAAEAKELLGKYTAIEDIVGKTLTELKGIYNHMELCAQTSGDKALLTQPNVGYLKDTIDGLLGINKIEQDNVTRLESAIKAQTKIDARQIAEAQPAQRQDSSVNSTDAEQYNIMVGKDKKHVTSLNTALAELKAAGTKKGLDVKNLTPVIVYNEKTPFVAYDQKGHSLELHRVAVEQDALAATEQVTFDRRAWGAYEDRHMKGNDHFTLSDVVDHKGKSVKFKTYNKPEVGYKAPVEGHEKDRSTINGSFNIPNLMVLTTHDGDRLAYVAVAPHTSRGDYMKMAAMDAAFFGFGNVAGNYWDFNIIHPFGGGGGKGVTQLPPSPFDHNFP